ncbi:MAG: glycine betaine ABC transporter substrate-binding protein [Ilumatobacteraceae bacterium]
MKRTSARSRRLTRALAPVTLAALALAACGGSDGATLDTTGTVAPRITVTAVKGDVRSELLSAIYARVLEDAGYRVSRKDPVDLDRAGYVAALQAGDFSLIPDWSHELLSFVLRSDGATAPTTTPAPSTTAAPTTSTASDASTTTTFVPTNGRSVQEQMITLASALPEGIAVGQPVAAEDKTVIACTPAVMKANENQQFVGYTNLAFAAPTIRLAGSAAWMKDTEEGWPAFQEYYGGDFKALVTVEDADVEQAVDDDTADCFALHSLDGAITRAQLSILQDDKSMVRGNAGLPLLASTVATADLVQVLTQANNALTTAKLNQMINQVTTNGTDPTTVANAFLDTQGNLSSSTSLAG